MGKKLQPIPNKHKCQDLQGLIQMGTRRSHEYFNLGVRVLANIVIAVSILDYSVTHAHTYIIIVYVFPLQRTGIYLVKA